MKHDKLTESIEKLENEEPTKPKVVDEIQKFKDKLLSDDECDIRCIVFSVLENNSNHPVVVYYGDKVECAALSNAVHSELKNRIINIMDGNNEL